MGILVSVVVVIPIYINSTIKSTHSNSKSVPWSHKCYSTIYKENTANACRDALEAGFLGIEIDLICENGACNVKHSIGEDSNETLLNILYELENYTYSIYIDLKNKIYDENATKAIYSDLELYPPGGDVVIEIQNDKYREIFEEKGYKPIELGKDAYFKDTWKSVWPIFYLSSKETYVFTIYTQCEYETIALTNPSVILVDLSSPSITCSSLETKDTENIMIWVFLWCMIWVCVVVCIYKTKTPSISESLYEKVSTNM